MKQLIIYNFTFFILLMLVGCTSSPTGEAKGEERAWDVDYNFVLSADSLVLQEDRPMHLLIVPEQTDSFVVYKDDPLVVAQIEIIPEDSIDSVWVKVARDQLTQGWVHESTLLDAVVPDDPISQGIHLFSDRHVVATIALFVIALAAWLFRRMKRRRFHIVHIDDIASPYPMLLCLTFAAATVLYTTIQIFVPQLWVNFYFHPTLNPFGQPTMLTIFLALAWLIVILAIAAMDDIRRSLNATEAILYTLSLLAILAVIYLFFSLTTQYFLGYFLWMAYAALALWQYLRRHRPRYRCGLCGAPLHDQGTCPKCGTINR
ncbi:MAG: zinc ribbon domain-containing protein [Bacteroidaceae bacterium]|nr:zinc ribbon domain-containing protein [Bacteroidaceae bacterium]